MAKINNSTVINKMRDELGLYPAINAIPTELAEKILPVYNLNPAPTVEVINTPATVVESATAFRSGTAATVYTTPSTGKFYLTNALISMCVKGGIATAYNAVMTVVIGGVTKTLFQLQDDHVVAAEPVFTRESFNFSNPILIDAGTDIIIDGSSAATTTVGSIVGYTTD